MLHERMTTCTRFIFPPFASHFKALILLNFDLQPCLNLERWVVACATHRGGFRAQFIRVIVVLPPSIRHPTHTVVSQDGEND
jgi:hypothetical protein